MNEEHNEQLLVDKGYRKYAGEDIDVFYNIDVCEHVGNCVKGSQEVFDPKRKPWILPDAKPADEVGRIVNTCPTGALKFIRKGDA